jgi:hypothetical protein
MSARAIIPSQQIGTPETYLNPQRAQGFLTPLRPGVREYRAPGRVGLDQWALGGRWSVGGESITPAAPGAVIEGGVQARDVYLVMTSAGGVPRSGRVLLGGRPIPARYAGTDVGRGGRFTVRGERLYNLVKLGADATFRLEVQLPPGVSAYDFTFG